jgi:hypothetical protein
MGIRPCDTGFFPTAAPSAWRLSKFLWRSRASAEAAAFRRVTPTGVLVVAFPGRSGTSSLLTQARRLQGRTPLPVDVIDLGA